MRFALHNNKNVKNSLEKCRKDLEQYEISNLCSLLQLFAVVRKTFFVSLPANKKYN
jgi:hypothetical protein